MFKILNISPRYEIDMVKLLGIQEKSIIVITFLVLLSFKTIIHFVVYSSRY